MTKAHLRTMKMRGRLWNGVKNLLQSAIIPQSPREDGSFFK